MQIIQFAANNNYIMEAIEVITYRGVDIEVCYDTDPSSPGDWGNDDRFLVYDHRDFSVERKGFDPTDIFEQTSESKKFFYDGYFVFPVFAYIHSGVSLSLGRTSYPFSCRWDTSMEGFALIKQEKGTYHRESARKAAEGLVEEWNMYLSGDVYGYDSEYGGCWGFYGKEGKKEMIEQAKSEIDYFIQLKQKKYFERKKVEIKNHIPLEKRTVYQYC